MTKEWAQLWSTKSKQIILKFSFCYHMVQCSRKDSIFCRHFNRNKREEKNYVFYNGRKVKTMWGLCPRTYFKGSKETNVEKNTETPQGFIVTWCTKNGFFMDICASAVWYVGWGNAKDGKGTWEK